MAIKDLKSVVIKLIDKYFSSTLRLDCVIIIQNPVIIKENSHDYR